MKLGPDDPIDVETVSRWIAYRVEGSSPTDHPDVDLYAYGGTEDDPTISGRENMTTILALEGNRQRWFAIEVTEFVPEAQSLWERDHDVIATLHQRATGRRRWFPG